MSYSEDFASAAHEGYRDDTYGNTAHTEPKHLPPTNLEPPAPATQKTCFGLPSFHVWPFRLSSEMSLVTSQDDDQVKLSIPVVLTPSAPSTPSLQGRCGTDPFPICGWFVNVNKA